MVETKEGSWLRASPTFHLGLPRAPDARLLPRITLEAACVLQTSLGSSLFIHPFNKHSLGVYSA